VPVADPVAVPVPVPVIPAAYLLVRHRGEATLHALHRFPLTVGSGGPGEGPGLGLDPVIGPLPAPLTVERPEPMRWRLRTPPAGPGLLVGGLQLFDAVVGPGFRFELGPFRMALQPVGLTLVIESWLPPGPVGPGRLRMHRLQERRVTIGGRACALGIPCAAFLREHLEVEVVGAAGDADPPRLRVRARFPGAVRRDGVALDEAELDELAVLEVGPARLRLHLEHGVELAGGRSVALASAVPSAVSAVSRRATTG
jgi:hypothetical protein